MQLLSDHTMVTFCAYTATPLMTSAPELQVWWLDTFHMQQRRRQINEVCYVTAQVRGRMQHLKEDLFEKVSAVLDCPNNSPNGQAALRAALAGRWKAALDKTARFWARQRDGSGAARDELQGRLRDLHQDIHATIDAEVGSTSFYHGGVATYLFLTRLQLGRLLKPASIHMCSHGPLCHMHICRSKCAHLMSCMLLTRQLGECRSNLGILFNMQRLLPPLRCL